MNMKKSLISLLVLLMTAVSGAWAQEGTLLTTILSTGDNASFKSGSKTFDNKATVTFSGEVQNEDQFFGWYSDPERTLTVTAAEGYTITRVKFYNDEGSAFDEQAPFEAILGHIDWGYITKVNGTIIGRCGVTKIEVYGCTDAELVDEVIAKITAIGTVTYTPESKALIDAARTAYDALTAALQALVTNYSTLTDAETTYATAEEAAFIEGVELTPTGTKNEWALAAKPAFYVELEVEYETALALNEVDDNTAKLEEWDGYEADVTMTRTLVAGSWNTFAMPFTISSSTLNTLGITAKKLVSSSLTDGTLTLNFEDAENIEAGKPYLVKVSADLSFKDNTFNSFIVSKTATNTETDAVDFIPTLGATTIEGSDTKAVLFLAAGNKLKNPTELPANMKGFRAYFQLKGEAALAKSFSIDFGDGETTGINLTPAPSPKGEGGIYTLDGRRISKATQKGVYIQNGKKVIIRSATQGDACQSKK